jgi:hypothetical protein
VAASGVWQTLSRCLYFLHVCGDLMTFLRVFRGELAGLLFAVLLRRNIRRASQASHRVVVSTHRGSRSSLRPRPSATASTVLVSASCSPYDVACPAEPVGLALFDIDH